MICDNTLVIEGANLESYLYKLVTTSFFFKTIDIIYNMLGYECHHQAQKQCLQMFITPRRGRKQGTKQLSDSWTKHRLAQVFQHEGFVDNHPQQKMDIIINYGVSLASSQRPQSTCSDGSFLVGPRSTLS